MLDYIDNMTPLSISVQSSVISEENIRTTSRSKSSKFGSRETRNHSKVDFYALLK